MKCPLMLIVASPTSEYVKKGEADCLKEGCAWWNEEKNCCSLKVIAKELTNIQLKRKEVNNA